MKSNPGGKGHAPRPLAVDRETFESNYDAIFGSKQAPQEPQFYMFEELGGQLYGVDTCGVWHAVELGEEGQVVSSEELAGFPINQDDEE